MKRRANSPYRLDTNRVPIFYRGGENIDRFRGVPATDRGPEDWVASMTPLIESTLPPGAPPETGISPLPDGTLLRTAVQEDPEGWLGAPLAGRWDGNSALLVKLLDAGVRLPVHYHPSRAFASEHLGSPFGKTEGWIIMDGAPGGDVWLGFREEVSQAQMLEWIEAQASEEMLSRMNRIPATAGSVFYVPAGVPHAIGPGVMLTELQEPTAFSILAEHDAFGLDDDEATLGLGWPLGVTAADLSAYDSTRMERIVPKAQILVDDENGQVTQLFGDEANEFFGALRFVVAGARLLPQSFIVLVVESGAGTLESAAGEMEVGAGETWVLPHATGPASLSGDVNAIVCLPPDAA